jgi:hypothetical protein
LRLSHRTLRPVSIGAKGVALVLLRILVWNAYVTCMHGGVVPACLPPWPTRRCPLSDLLISASATLVHFTPLGMAGPC